MSKYEQKAGTGASFPNKKRSSESAPNLLGTLTIPPEMAGKKVNIASWLNTKEKQGEDDLKYYAHKLSLIEPKEEKTNVDLNDSIPF
tara:strand:+ start:3545 stop:3805 length:261 start_codon:yes stop_codon:yes gene_type:complete